MTRTDVLSRLAELPALKPLADELAGRIDGMAPGTSLTIPGEGFVLTVDRLDADAFTLEARGPDAEPTAAPTPVPAPAAKPIPIPPQAAPAVAPIPITPAGPAGPASA